MRLTDVLPFFPPVPVISIAGAGGKTTLMFRLGELLPGTSVLTTTTKVGESQILAADTRVTADAFPPDVPGKTVWVSPSLEPVKGKIAGFGTEEFAGLARLCRAQGLPLIYESDGAACRHIKAPATHEPAVMPESDVCFYLVGLDVLGCPLDAEHVHRPELFSAVTGLPLGEPITKEAILSLLGSPDGGLKRIPESALKIAYLTHADTEERIRAAEFIAAEQKWYDYTCINS